MKKITVLALLAAAFAAVSALAAVRRPDPRSMRPYVVGVLVKGPKWTSDRTPHGDSVQAAHLANIRAMANTGVLLGAGPFAGNERERGLFLFRDIPIDSAAALARQDPAIQEERLMIELYRWYAPIGIGEAYQMRAKLRPDKPDSMIRVPMAFLERSPAEPRIDSLALARSTETHVGMILDQLKSGQLLAAGPVFGNGRLMGFSFYGTDSVTALRLVKEDPTVQNGHMAIRMRQWWTAWGVLPPVPTVKEMAP